MQSVRNTIEFTTPTIAIRGLGSSEVATLRNSAVISASVGPKAIAKANGSETPRLRARLAPNARVGQK